MFIIVKKTPLNMDSLLKVLINICITIIFASILSFILPFIVGKFILNMDGSEGSSQGPQPSGGSQGPQPSGGPQGPQPPQGPQGSEWALNPKESQSQHDFDSNKNSDEYRKWTDDKYWDDKSDTELLAEYLEICMKCKHNVVRQTPLRFAAAPQNMKTEFHPYTSGVMKYVRTIKPDLFAQTTPSVTPITPELIEELRKMKKRVPSSYANPELNLIDRMLHRVIKKKK